MQAHKVTTAATTVSVDTDTDAAARHAREDGRGPTDSTDTDNTDTDNTDTLTHTRERNAMTDDAAKQVARQWARWEQYETEIARQYWDSRARWREARELAARRGGTPEFWRRQIEADERRRLALRPEDV